MDIADALEYCSTHHRSVLVARKSDGTPQPSPVAHATDGEGRLVVSSRAPAYKVRNLRRDPRVTLCCLPDEWWGRWIVVDGTAEIVELPEAMEGLVAYYRQVAGEHPDWDDYRAAMQREQRVLIRITPTSAGPDVEG